MALTTFQSPIDLQLAQTPQTRNPELYKELALLYNAVRVLQQGITALTGSVQADPSTWDLQQASDTLIAGNLRRFYCVASEDIGFGQLVRFIDDGSDGVKAELATATGLTKPAQGFCSVSTGVVSGNYAEFIINEGLVEGLTGLTPGQRYWLSLTAGNITNVKPTATTQIGQYIGFALSSTQLYVRMGMPLRGDYLQY